MKIIISSATVAGAAALLLAAASARAEIVTLPGGAVANYQQNNGGQGATGTISGTIQQGTTNTPINCTFDAVQGQLTGSPACAQLLTGTTGAQTLRRIEKPIVALRTTAASALQATANTRMIDDLVQRRVGAAFAIEAQVGVQGANSGPAPSGLGSWGYVGGSFVGDDRLGFEKSGHDIAATVGVDHAGSNALVGGYVGYLKSDIDLTSLQGDLSSKGWTAGAYLTYLLGPVLSMSASGSYAHTNADLRRTFAGSQVSAEYGHTEWSGSATVNGNWRLGDAAGFTALTGLAYGTWRDDAYTDSRGIAFDQARGKNTWFKAGSILTFFSSPTFRPYATATYSRLLSAMGYNTGRDALNVGGGVALISGRFSGGVEVSTLLLQPGQRNTSVGLNFRLAI